MRRPAHSKGVQRRPSAQRITDAGAVLRLINVIANRATAAATFTLREFGFGVTEARILHLLAQGQPMSAARVANRLQYDRGGISRATYVLLTRGLVEKNGDRTLALTALGAQIAIQVAHLHDRQSLHLTEKLSGPQLASLHRLLMELRDALGNGSASTLSLLERQEIRSVAEIPSQSLNDVTDASA